MAGVGTGGRCPLATRLLERDAVRLVATVRDPSAAPRLQALAEAQLVDEFSAMSIKAYDYLERTQILCSAASRVSPARR